MREILFRGKRADTGDWVYGVPTKDGHGETVMVESTFECDEYNCRGANCLYVNENTVGQYTGSTDKNDKKIFEGDIVKSYNRHIGWVEFRSNTFVKRCYCHLFGNAIHGDDQTVIGNIYDNPELLRGDTE